MINTSMLESLHLTDWPHGESNSFPHNFLVTDNQDLVFLTEEMDRKPAIPSKLFVDIWGEGKRRIDVSYLSKLNTGLHKYTLFAYKDGFGLINHDKPELHLWADHVSEPSVIEVVNASKDIDVYDNYLRFASYDSIDNRFVIGIGKNNSPRAYAKWWATLSVEDGKGVWSEAHGLERQNYPETYLHYQSDALEWLNISNLTAHGGKKYILTPGGQRTVGRSGREFEFLILGVYDRDDRLEQNIELEIGYGQFSTNKRYYLVKPKTKKRILIYDLDKQTLEHNVPLKPETSLGKIPVKHVRNADLSGDRLYVGSIGALTISKLDS